MSADLVWQIVKNNNAFLVKKNGVQFSSEPGNLTNLNSFKCKIILFIQNQLNMLN